MPNLRGDEKDRVRRHPHAIRRPPRVTLAPLLARRLDDLARDEHLTTAQLVTSLLRESVRALAAPPRVSRASRDAVFYRGPSLLTGDPIVGVLTGLAVRTSNAKTGPVLQTWILRSDRTPMDAVRQNLDDAICGDCALRGRDGRDRRCYVAPWLAPNNVWRTLERYPEVSWPELEARTRGRSLRLGAYGDPAAIPFEVWQVLLAPVAGWIGYTHQWRTCDPRFKTIVMASVDSEAEWHDAHAAGWRTFRVLTSTENVLIGKECACPASDEMGHRTTCERCQLCRGTSRPARSVAIRAHGYNGALVAFYRDRSEAAS